MSHYVTAKTQFLCENEDVLLSALRARFPEATILRNAKVRGWRGVSQPEADIVVRFRNPESEAQGNYDLGFVKNGENYDAVAEWGYRAGGYGICGYEEVLEGCSQAGNRGVVEGLMEPYVKAAVTRAMQTNPALANYSMGTVTDTEHQMKENGKKKNVKHIRLSGGSSHGAGGSSAGGGWGA
jgi:hypothetical protein